MDAALFAESTLTARVAVPFGQMGSNIDEHLIASVRERFEGKCCAQGYVETDSCELVGRSAARVESGALMFEVTFRCNICLPVKGTRLQVKCTTKSRAGIHATAVLKNSAAPPPLDVMVLFDQADQERKQIMESFEEGQLFWVTVADYNYQLEDTTIVVLCTF